jgi:hypothetical protein
MPRPRAKIAVRVVLDTTAIYSEKAGQTLSGHATRAFSKTDEYPQLDIEWCLPVMVVHERQVQIVQQCVDWKEQGGEQLRKALSLTIDLSEESIKRGAMARLDADVQKYGLQVLKPACDRIAWESIVQDAAERNAPFSAGKEEKGFRDRVIGETFLQAIAEPSSDRRFVLITNDAGLGDWVRARIAGRADVLVLADFEQLLAFLTALATQQDEARAISLQVSAAERFYRPDDSKSLFDEWNLSRELGTRSPPELLIAPPGTNRRQEEFSIASPEYIKHERHNRIHWLSRVTVEVTYFEFGIFTPHQSLKVPGLLSPMLPQPSSGTTIVAPSTSSAIPPASLPSSGWSPAFSLGFGEQAQSFYQKVIRKGTCEFKVGWSAVEKDGELVDPRLEAIEPGPVIWDR